MVIWCSAVMTSVHLQSNRKRRFVFISKSSVATFSYRPKPLLRLVLRRPQMRFRVSARPTWRFVVEQDVSVHQIMCARLPPMFSDASSLLRFSEDGPADTHRRCRDVSCVKGRQRLITDCSLVSSLKMKRAGRDGLSFDAAKLFLFCV